MKTQTTIIQLAFVLVAAFFATANAEAQEATITGELKYLQAPNGRVYLAIDSDKRVATKGDDGSLVSSKVIQLAIPDPELGKKAMELIGKRVKSQGKPMAAHTQHHHTEVLWVVSSIDEVLTVNNTEAPPENPAQKDTKQGLNPHSVEW